MDELQKTIEEIYPILPEDLKAVITDPGLKDKFQAIATAHSISEDQLTRLKDETYLVLLGLSDLSDYTGNVKRGLEVGLDRATSIALDVYKNIFQPVEETLEAIENSLEPENEEGKGEDRKEGTPSEAFKREPEVYSPPTASKPKNGDGESLRRLRQELAQIPQTPKATSTPEKRYVPPTTEPRTGTSPAQTRPARFSPAENLGKQDQPRFSQSGNLGARLSADASAQAERRYGVEPARDLGTDDFDWKGSVGGVEIESQHDEIGDSNEEDLDKNKILEEIEHPPSYAPKTPFENQVFGNSKQTDFRPKSQAPENLPTKEPDLKRNPREIENARKERYHNEDPYREPTE